MIIIQIKLFFKWEVHVALSWHTDLFAQPTGTLISPWSEQYLVIKNLAGADRGQGHPKGTQEVKVKQGSAGFLCNLSYRTVGFSPFLHFKLSHCNLVQQASEPELFINIQSDFSILMSITRIHICTCMCTHTDAHKLCLTGGGVRAQKNYNLETFTQKVLSTDWPVEQYYVMYSQT